jgi:AraC family transcriptional regulator, activator of mtrCDE
MLLHADAFSDWLLEDLELHSTLFHVGQYCGAWQASTSGHRRASFHVVLHGRCWLHLPAGITRPARSVALAAGDAVFLLSDQPHCLSPDAQPPAPGRESARSGQMTPVDARGPEVPDSLGLACGFFEFKSGLDDLVVGLLPDHVIARHDQPAQHGARQIFELIRAEALRDPHAPSPLIARLTSLLFVYTLRALDSNSELAPCFWALLRRPAFAPLIAAIVAAPGERWTTATMADFVHMSRARFCKQFAELAGQPPAQFVTLVRMKCAASMLSTGASMPDAAEQVGYQSESAFAQAFKRVTGLQPGAWRRTASESTRGALH